MPTSIMLYMLFISGIVFSCSDGSEMDQPDVATISGRIFNTKEKNLTIVLDKNVKGIENEKYEIEIENNGDFEFNAEIGEWVMAELYFNNSSIRLFLEPSKNLKIEFDGLSFKETLKFSGDGGYDNDYFNESYRQFEIEEHSGVNKMKIKNLKSAKLYKKYRDSIKYEHLNFYSSRSEKLSSVAQKVAIAQIEFRWGNTLLQYPVFHVFLHKKPLKPDFEAGYHDFIKTLNINEDILLPFGKYVDYLELFLSYQLKQKFIYNGLKYNHQNEYDNYIKYNDLYELADQYLKGKNRLAMQSFYLVSAIERGRFSTVAEKFKEFQKLNDENGIYVKAVNDTYDKLAKVVNGSIAPDFTLETNNGRKISLSSFKGKLIF